VATSLDAGSLTLDERGLMTLAELRRDPRHGGARRRAARAASAIPRRCSTSVTAEADTGRRHHPRCARSRLEPTEAADVANAFAEQFVAWRREIQQTSLDEAIATIDEEIEVAVDEHPAAASCCSSSAVSSRCSRRC
jgi:hypothetical protein